MTPLDAAFLDAEDEDQHANLAIASVAVLEGPAPSQEDVIAALAGRLPLVPRYRQKMRTIPLDLGRPVWVDDAAFDIRYHVRRTALPAPGGDHELFRLVARLMSQRLDREHPLWECWVIEGLAGGRWAMMTKLHHCMADGISGTQLYQAVFDSTPQPGRPLADEWEPDTEPSTLQLTAEALRDLVTSPVEQVRLLTRALSNPLDAVRRIGQTAGGLLALARAVAVPASASSLGGPIGRYRRYAAGRAQLADVVRVARHFHTSMNDVVLSAIAGGFRTLLLQRGEKPDARAIRSLVPVSVRVPGHGNGPDNRVSLMLPFLPIDVADPVQRLARVHEAMADLKASGEAEAGEAMTSLATHEPYPPISWGIRLASHLPQRSIITVTTNVPGPREPLYLLGRRVLEILPYVPIAVRLRTGVSILTYCDRVAFGVTSDYGTAPEAELLARAIEGGIEELVAACPAPPAPAEAPAAKTQAPAAKAQTSAAQARGGAARARSTRAGRTPAKAPARVRPGPKPKPPSGRTGR